MLAGVFVIGLFFYSNRFIRYQEPQFLTFSELKKISKNPHPGGLLERKLDRFWRTPIISNGAYYHGVKPYRPADPQLGTFLHLVSWNIEKSIRMKDAVTVFSSADSFRSLIDPQKAPPRIP